MTSDEQLRVEKFKIDNFMRLGCTIYTAVSCVDRGIDWHEVESIMDKGANLVEALDIAR
jgi:hypothetical protein